MKNFWVVLLLVVMTFACSNKSGGGGGGSNSFVPGKPKGEPNNPNNPNNNTGKGETCLFSEGNLCVEFTGGEWTSTQIHNICANYQGTIAQASCRTGNIVAECLLNKGLANEAVMKYYSPITRENAATDCDDANGILR